MEKITNLELRDIFTSCKQSRFSKEPNFEEVLDTVAEKLEVEKSDLLPKDL